MEKNIYKIGKELFITSNEEIKEGYYLDLTHNIIMKSVFYPSSDKNCKKIILTTDADLIKDGVQAIDDEFLEWFVKNPSCEEVETKLIEEIPSGFTFGMFGNDEPPTELVYKIIIPKEEPKQDDLNHFLSTSSVIVKDPKISNFNKQETLEEAKQMMVTQEDIFEQIALTEARGEKIVKYLNRYKGDSIYNEIALAIEFGYQLKLEEDEK